MPFAMDNPALWRDTVVALRFFSRLPLPALPGEADPHGLPDFTRLIRAVPLAGFVLGGLAGLVVLAASLVLPAVIAALLGVAAAVVMTGAFHEDGLADSADSFGGMTTEKRLDIMKDSRIGTFGAAALILGLGLRVAGIAALVAAVGGGRTALAMAAIGAASRTVALGLQVHLDPARVEGAAYATGRPQAADWHVALAIAAGLALLLIPAGGIAGAFLAFGVAGLILPLAIRFASAHVGGQTGDLTGATQQVIEIAILLVLVAMAAPGGAIR